MNSLLSGCRRWLLIVGAAFGATRSVAAQAPTPAATQKDSKPWQASGTLRVEEQANNNVFLLSDALKARLDTLTAPAPPGTHFTDMASASDFITLVGAAFDFEGPGLLGRTLTIRPTARYDYYARNPKRGNVELGLSIAQSVWHNGRLHLRGSLVPSYFYRNFMSDAQDLNGDGSIEANERIYAAGTYHDNRVFVGYQHRLVRATRTQPLGVAVELAVGHVVRNYDAPLAYRSYRGPEVDATLALELSKALKFDAGYEHASLNSKPDSAVLVLNEPDFNFPVDPAVRRVQQLAPRPARPGGRGVEPSHRSRGPFQRRRRRGDPESHAVAHPLPNRDRRNHRLHAEPGVRGVAVSLLSVATGGHGGAGRGGRSTAGWLTTFTRSDDDTLSH